LSTTRTARKLSEQIRQKRLPVWIVVASRSGAWIFSAPGARVEASMLERRQGGAWSCQLIEHVNHPEGRLKGRDLISDEPGRVMGRVSSERHAYAPETDPARILAEQFARVLAEKLRLARARNQFRRVILIAESRFLGLLRASLDRATAVRVATSLEKDWQGETLPEIQKRIEPLVGRVQRRLALEHERVS
jgi:protein required for attachment to host cells